MLLGTSQTPEDEIIMYLVKHGSTTVHTLRQQITSKISIQRIYQILKDLVRAGIAVKAKNNYSITFSWISELHHFAASGLSTALRGVPLPVPPENTRKRWTCSDLSSLLVLWDHLIHTLARTVDDKKLYQWAPHAWFQYVSTGYSDQFYSMIDIEKVRSYIIIGNDTPLDRGYAQFVKSSNVRPKFARCSFTPLYNQYFSIIGDYIIDVTLDAKFAKKLDLFFQKTESLNTKTIHEAGQFVQSRCKSSVVVSFNPRRVKKLMPEFEKVLK